jgi:hypothetical protein
MAMKVRKGRFEFTESDSLEAKFQQAFEFARAHGTFGRKRGVLASVHAKTAFNALGKTAKKCRWPRNLSPLTLTPNQLNQHVRIRAKQVSGGQVKNEMGPIRITLKLVGRWNTFAHLTNEKLEIPKRSRIGKGRPTNPVKLAEAIAKAGWRTLPLILIALAFGLRSMELVEANASLFEWKYCLMNGLPVRVQAGAKNNRERFVFIPPDAVSAALHAIELGIALVKKQGRLVKSVNPAAASQQFRARLRAVGLWQENSPHSLRRSFIMKNYNYYLSAGMGEDAALSACSADLGHGEERGRWVYNNYLRAELKSIQETVAEIQ